MSQTLGLKKISKALISVYHKEGLTEIVNTLISGGVEIISTGGTYDYLKNMDIPVTSVEEITSYPSIFGGRVKTLHPKIFGGILYRRDVEEDLSQRAIYDIPQIDLVIVDLYPFEEYVKAGADHSAIIEKIDIGGISLIRGAAKNYKDVIIVPSSEEYPQLLDVLKKHECASTLSEREYFATKAFLTSSHYDTMIFEYFNKTSSSVSFSKSYIEPTTLRYGENPHQKGLFFGDKNALPKQLHGKEISYNNLLDIEAAIELISDFSNPTVAIIKHNNACGCATRQSVLEAWKDALSADPVSAFGGIIISNREIDLAAAEEINKIFFEVIIAPSYDADALMLLKSKKNRIILQNKNTTPCREKFKSLLSGVLVQQRDDVVEKVEEVKLVTPITPDPKTMDDLLFANILVKHSKSNAIVLAKNRMLLSSGIGQTSRVDALRQAIDKAKSFNLSLDGAVMASDAFFPFPDCVEIAHKAGIKAVIHPGGSIRDQESIDYCIQNDLSMVITGIRHFKH